jgi:hypothetical protein
LFTIERVFAAHGLEIFDVEELWTHGGSLRIYARHAGEQAAPSVRVEDLRRREAAFGIAGVAAYQGFEERVRATKRRLLEFLIAAADRGERVAGYGAPGKGNTLLNYCGIRTDLLAFTVDRSPHKQGKYLPGTHIPILHPDALADARPDWILVLPWNLKDEIVGQLAYARDWGARFVTPIPEVAVIT